VVRCQYAEGSECGDIAPSSGVRKLRNQSIEAGARWGRAQVEDVRFENAAEDEGREDGLTVGCVVHLRAG
jgi:hypothetical protein